MKFRTLKYTFSALMIIFALISCEKDELNNIEASKVESGYNTENGYIKFKSINAYIALYGELSKATTSELTAWNKKLPFKSLETKYNEEKIEMYVTENKVNNEMNEIINTKRLRPSLASLFNESGVLVINDTILKIKDEFIFTITNGDYTLLEKIENNIDFKSEYITKNLHTIKLESTKEENPDGLQKTISDRTLVFYTSSKTRESVNFDAFLSGGFVVFEMTGRYQKKSWLGWILSESSTMVYGKINAAGSYANILNVNTNNPILYNEESIYLTYFVDMPPKMMIPFNLYVTYSYKKTNSQAYINEWGGISNTTEGTFTRNYYWQQF